MDTSRKFDNKSPEVTSNFFTKLAFGWVLPFFRVGLKNDLEIRDLYNTTPPDLSELLGNELEKNWADELSRAKREKKDASLWRTLRATYARPFAVWGAILFLQSIVFKLSHPIILAHLIKYFDPARPYAAHDGWLLAAGVVGVSLLNVLCVHHANVGCLRVGMRCRIACCSLMYRKLLRLSHASLRRTAAGQMINLMSNDVQRFEHCAPFLHHIWIMPIQAAVAGYLMYDGVGWPALVGVLTIALQAIPLQGYLSRLQGAYRAEIAVRTDNRVKIMAEIASGIRVIKTYAWERPFEKVVALARRLEVDVIAKKSYILGYTTALMVFTERTSLYVAVLCYVLSTGGPLTGELVFSMAQFYNTIQLHMAILFPLGVAFLSECHVSVERINAFLLLGENLRLADVDERVEQVQRGTIRVVKGRASWTPGPIIETLSNINVEIPAGSLVAIVGAVGSGKSSLLQLLLRELPLSGGKLEVHGDVSYAAQEPWLFAATVRNNILFGQPYVKARYRRVVEACALDADFRQLPHGDKTLVGERGACLSGGQRARIGLARAAYRAADIYLFDDPLSAVDARVARQLFDECVGRNLAGKTRILVTHQLQLLESADTIIVMNNGQIEKIGRYADLKHVAVLEEDAPIQAAKRTKRLTSITSHESSPNDDEEDEPQETQELMEKGAIPTSTYVEYFKSGASACALGLLTFLVLVAQVFCNASDLWLKHWTNQEEELCDGQRRDYASTFAETATDDGANATSFRCATDDFPREFNVYLYTGLILGAVILTTARSLLFYKVCMNASQSLHARMFANLLQATMRFFDTNPSGRILNRFSRDVGVVDEILPRLMLDSVQIFLVMAGILAMVWIVSPIMIVPTIALGALFACVRRVYMASAQDIKRLEAVTRAPVFSHVSASLAGIATIRSSGAQRVVAQEFDVLQDGHTSSFVLMIFTGAAFGFYLDLLSVLFVAIVALQFFAYDRVSEGDVGLVVSQALILTGMLQYGMRQTTEVANNMTSVERVLQYTRLEKEGPFESTPARKPHRDWPARGEIKIKNLYLQYAGTDLPVLKDVNLEIPAGCKVGIVGRTGAGKSSIISAVFRLAPIVGTVTIDGVDTDHIGLTDLRSNISIIPQEPVLFSTTVRHNLDPFGRTIDETLWRALEDVELKDVVLELDQAVSEGGSNFSAGQRQLICMARAIVRRNKVIIMDEATANVDRQTDALIQKTIRKNFRDCTVLTIAHRLDTIMDSDRVVVMDRGEIVEYAHPYELLQNRDGVFYAMLLQTGDGMFANLFHIAKESHEQANVVGAAASMHSIALNDSEDNKSNKSQTNHDDDDRDARAATK